MLNLGKVTRRWLADIGIRSVEDIEREGVVNVYVRLKSLGYNTSLNLLWALQGAVLGIRWSELPPEMMAKLRQEAEEVERKEKGTAASGRSFRS